jgi:hypothetical protein
MNQMLYQSLNQRWSAIQGVYPDVGVFFQAIHANALLSCGVRPCQKKKPRKMLCGLGSWREQQQTNDANQKFTCRLTRPHKILRGFRD